jgi:hypothetical protein
MDSFLENIFDRKLTNPETGHMDEVYLTLIFAFQSHLQDAQNWSDGWIAYTKRILRLTPEEGDQLIGDYTPTLLLEKLNEWLVEKEKHHPPRTVVNPSSTDVSSLTYDGPASF